MSFSARLLTDSNDSAQPRGSGVVQSLLSDQVEWMEDWRNWWIEKWWPDAHCTTQHSTARRCGRDQVYEFQFSHCTFCFRVFGTRWSHDKVQRLISLWSKIRNTG